MSNKKQPYIGKPTTSSETVVVAGSVPPRYQPPPQPGVGILKHPPQLQGNLAQIPSTSNIHSKDANKHPYMSMKNPTQQSLDPSKYYPTTSAFGPPLSGAPTVNPNQISPSGYPPYPQHIGIPVHRPYRLPSGEPKNFEDGLPPNSRPQLPPHSRIPDEGFNQRNSGVLIKSDEQQQQLTATNFVDQPQQPRQIHVPLVYRTQRLSDDELLRLPPAEMLKFVRKTESDGARIANEQHRHIQGLINEIRALKEANQRLGDDNQELRDLCCFLDDDRQKGRKLAREWQRFGRYTASVMRQEVSAYQNKLRELDNKQQELIKDNLELKELCLYLDEERGGSSVCPSCGSATSGGMRDDGDGSSSSTNADEPAINTEFNGVNATPRRSASRERLLHETLTRQRNTFNDQTMQYVRSLEQRVKQLEDEKRALQNKMSELSDGDPNIINNLVDSNLSTSTPPVLSGRPEAVVRALQVLEVREQLERESRNSGNNTTGNNNNLGLSVDIHNSDSGQRNRNNDGDVNGSITSDMDDGEKALVREMCNVVWRKLEEAPVQRR